VASTDGDSAVQGDTVMSLAKACLGSEMNGREIECLLNDNHQKGKMMIMIMKTSRSQVDSPVAEGKRTEGGGRKMCSRTSINDTRRNWK